MADPLVALSVRKFVDAVRGFAQPSHEWDGYSSRMVDSLYDRLRGALTSRVGRGGYEAPSSSLPCRLDALALLVTVDQEVALWGAPAGTVDALRTLTEQAWAPEQRERLDGYTDLLVRWTAAATELLRDAPPVVPLRNTACPACGAREVWRDVNGERCRTAPLRVSELGAYCVGCDARWEPQRLEWFAKLIGCEPLPA